MTYEFGEDGIVAEDDFIGYLPFAAHKRLLAAELLCVCRRGKVNMLMPQNDKFCCLRLYAGLIESLMMNCCRSFVDKLDLGIVVLFSECTQFVRDSDGSCLIRRDITAFIRSG